MRNRLTQGAWMLFVLVPSMAMADLPGLNESMEEGMLEVLIALDAAGSILAVILVIFGIFHAFAKDSLSTLAVALAAAVGCSTLPTMMATVLGLELKEAVITTDGLTTLSVSVADWLTAHLFVMGVGLITVAVEALLCYRAYVAYVRYRQQAVVAVWKHRLLDALAQGLQFIDDEILRLRLSEQQPDTDVDKARERLRNLLLDAQSVQFYDFGTRPSLLRYQQHLANILKSEVKSQLLREALEPLAATLQQLPKTLAQAREQIDQTPTYDEMLREQVRHLPPAVQSAQEGGA